MIILDTNVISELMQQEPHAAVTSWLEEQKQMHLAVTTITLAEIDKGLALMTEGKRRDSLVNKFNLFVEMFFKSRIYSFDEKSAFFVGNLTLMRKSQGLHTDAVDLMILAIAKAHKASIATRNIKDFSGCGVEIINPWK